jgi:hypothetical protein
VVEAGAVVVSALPEGVVEEEVVVEVEVGPVEALVLQPENSPASRRLWPP